MDISPSQPQIRLRQPPIAPHPPYGLYGDPRGIRQPTWAIDPRMLIGLATVLGSLGLVLSLASR